MSEYSSMENEIGEAIALSSWEAIGAVRERLEEDGRRLVFTNGCFDILHAGHVRFLREARALGDRLVVALNSDASVRQLKGEGRPVFPVGDRAEVLSALECVDHVVVFDGLRATDALNAIRPHIYAKGGDYTEESLNAGERAALHAAGSEIRILSLTPGRSTSAALRSLRGDGAGGQGPRPIRLGVLGSGRGSTLEGLFAAIDDGRLQAEVALVLSDVPEARILRIARERNVPSVFVDPGPYRTRLGAPAQKEMCDRLAAANVDLVILAGFMRLVKSPLLDVFAKRILNVHPSLLPEFRGFEAWKQALEAGVVATGCTVHRVDRGVDTGPVLKQKRVPVEPGDTPETLHRRIQAAERELFPAAIQEYGTAIVAARSGG